MFRALVIVAAALFTGTYVYAQCMTSQCIDALTGLSADSAASSCISVEKMLPIGTAIQNNASVVSIITNWLTSLCGQPACSNETIAAVHYLLIENCSDLDDWSFFNPDLYPTWRKAECLKNANGTLCTSEFLTDVESYSGTLTYAQFQRAVRAPPERYPANISCTNCAKAYYIILENDFPSDDDSIKSALQSHCGATFVDGVMPPGITQGANNATSTVTTTMKMTSLALGLFSQSLVMALTASAFVVVSTMYTILA